MATKSIGGMEQWFEASGATGCIAGLCLLVLCAVASLATRLCPTVVLNEVRNIAIAVGVIVYALIVVENMVTTSVGVAKRWLDASRATRSFVGLCLLVPSAVAYFAADHGVQHIEGEVGLFEETELLLATLGRLSDLRQI